MVARRAVAASMVVLKNDGNLLPLSKTATVALAGKTAQNIGNQCGGWTITWQGMTGDVTPGATSVRAALEAEVGPAHVVYSADGATTTGAADGRRRHRRDALLGRVRRPGPDVRRRRSPRPRRTSSRR